MNWLEAFSIERIGKSGTKFDINKAKWFNEQYLRAKSDAELSEYLLADLKKEDINLSQEKAESIVTLMKERATFPSDLWKEGKFMIIAPNSFDEAVAAKRWNNEAVTVLSTYKGKLHSLEEELNPDNAKALLEASAEENGIKLGKVMQAVRLAITGVGAGPDLMQVFTIIGKEELSKRIDFALDNLKVIV